MRLLFGLLFRKQIETISIHYLRPCFNKVFYKFLFVIILCVDILTIDNLWTFTGLVKLQLDNNMIERIENLGHLVNLQWVTKAAPGYGCVNGQRGAWFGIMRRKFLANQAGD